MSDILGDPARLEAVRRSALMESEPEEVFDRLTRLASRLLRTPVATMTLVDRDRQYFKSSVGTVVTQTPLSHSFCQHVVTDAAPLVVADARRDPRLRDKLAIRDLDVVAYCGVPLTDADGHARRSADSAALARVMSSRRRRARPRRPPQPGRRLEMVDSTTPRAG